MESALGNILLYGLLFLSTIAGVLLTIAFKPSEWVLSIAQHLAAGLVFAAATVEMLPSILKHKDPIPVTIGFILGFGILLAIRFLFKQSRPEGQEAVKTKSSMAPLIAAVSFDAIVDGLLVGLALAVGKQLGLTVALAMGAENFFLGGSLTESAAVRHISKKGLMVITIGISILLVIALFVGYEFIPEGGWLKQGIIAFGVASILYLVIEELMAKVHKNPDTLIETSSFFVGFLIILLMDLIFK